jgi:ATP-dependent DNA helicase MPH1
MVRSLFVVRSFHLPISHLGNHQLQRFGRTGRERAGFVHVLLAEEREEFNLEKARATYKEIQRAISRGDDLEFYSDVKRLLPDHIKPLPLERVMEIKPYVREEITKTKRSPRKALAKTKRKRNDDMMRNIPDGACTGFVSVADLIVNQSKRRKVVDVKTLDEEAEDDDLDKALDAGIDGLLPGKRTKSPASSSHLGDEDSPDKPVSRRKAEKARSGTSRNTTKPAAKSKPKKKAAETGGSEGKGKGNKTKAKGKKKEVLLSLSQQGRDDSVDRELENNPFVQETQQTEKTLLHKPVLPPSSPHPPETPKKRTKICTPSPTLEPIIQDPPDQEQRPATPCKYLVVSGTKSLLRMISQQVTQTGSRLKNREDPNDLTWVIDDDDDEPDIVILSSSPVVHEGVPHDNDPIRMVNIVSPRSQKQGESTGCL